MTRILLVTCSPRGQVAESHRLAQKIVGFLLRRMPRAQVINRFACDIPHISGSFATELGAPAAGSAKVFPDETFQRSDALIQELESADFVVIGTPVHNFTVPSALKAWIDHVVRARRTFDITASGKVGRLRDRPVFIAVSSGGRLSGERARRLDFMTPYMTAVLGMIGLEDLTFFHIEATALGQEAATMARAESNQALERYFSAATIDA